MPRRNHEAADHTISSSAASHSAERYGPLIKIAKIEAIPYSIPYLHPLHFASGAVHDADHVPVRVSTDEGIVGTTVDKEELAAYRIDHYTHSP